MPRAYHSYACPTPRPNCDVLQTESQGRAKPGTSGRKASQRRVQASSERPGTRPGPGLQHLTGNDLLPKATRHARVRVSGGYSNRPSLVLQSHCWQSFVSAQDDPLACDNAKQPRIPLAKQTACSPQLLDAAIDRNDGLQAPHEQLR